MVGAFINDIRLKSFKPIFLIFIYFIHEINALVCYHVAKTLGIPQEENSLMKKALLLATLAITGCNKKSDLVGHWVSEKCETFVLCSFHVIEKDDEGEVKLYAEFEDNGNYHELIDGPLIETSSGYYYIEGDVGNYELTYQDGMLVSPFTRYKKVK